MSGKYTLPNGVNANPLFMRHVVVWGLPFLGWIVLIVGWLFFSSSDSKSEKEETVKKEAIEQPAKPEALAQSATATAQTPAAPTQPASAQPQSATPPSAPVVPATPEASPAPGIIATAPYNFTTAVSKIDLPNESACNTGILVDIDTRKVLWAKGAERAVPIASMTKMMTLLLVEEAIAQGKIKRDTVIPVTTAAYKIGGSQVWLDPKESFPLSELLKAIAIKSANDAAYLVGEYLGEGDISTFVSRMNVRARELGMTHTTFYDAHGLGDARKRNNLASAHDMVLLAERLLNYSEVMKLASTRMDTFRNGKTELKNHNNLVFQRVPGVDGLKTGYTGASGYCVTFTCKRAGRRMIGCVTGFKAAKDRDKFCRALLDWGYEK